MIKYVHSDVLAFDAEWVPDQQAGRILYRLDANMSQQEVFEVMWREGGATEEDPRPYLKTILCRIVSISGLLRTDEHGEVSLKFITLPDDMLNPELSSERSIINRFLTAVGRRKPQLVGFNSFDADLKILIQRAMVNKIQAAEFSERPDKPWEGVDYFAKSQEWHLDLKALISSWGKASVSLNEIATLCGIPGKIEVDGSQVPELWLAGDYERIIMYNECDAVTTFLVWLRLAYFSGRFDLGEYEAEVERVRQLLEDLSPTHVHFKTYLSEWDRLKNLIGQS